MDDNWITAIATTALAAFGAVQIYREIYRAKATQNLAAKEKAFDLINRHVFDQQIVSLFERWRLLRSKYDNNTIDYGDILDSFERHKKYVIEARKSKEEARHEYDDIVQLLNFYEHVSLGIESGTIDETIYKSWWRSTFVADWLALDTFVRSARKQTENENLFESFERVAKRWQLPSDTS